MTELVRDMLKLEKLTNHQLINQTTGNQEWGTPPDIVEAARLTMGGIDLDPASTWEANRTVKATNIFTKGDNGLVLPWVGNVWVNWPFGVRENPLWVSKITREYAKADGVDQITCICFASTSERWFKPLKAFPQCYLDGRTNYIDLKTGQQVKGVSKGSVVTYLGWNLDAFAEYFGTLGDVLWPTRFVDRKFFRGY